MIITLLLAIATTDTTKLPPTPESRQLYHVINAGRVYNNVEKLELDSTLTYIAYRNCRKPKGNPSVIVHVSKYNLDHEKAATIMLNNMAYRQLIFNPYYKRVGVYIHKNTFCILLM